MLRELWRVGQEGSEDCAGNVADDQDDRPLHLGERPHQRVESKAVFGGRKF